MRSLYAVRYARVNISTHTPATYNRGETRGPGPPFLLPQPAADKPARNSGAAGPRPPAAVYGT